MKRMNLWNQEAKLVPHKQKDCGETAEIKHKEVFFKQQRRKKKLLKKTNISMNMAI